MLSLMRLSLAALTKRAIESSLQLNWKQAIELNTAILKDYPNNIDAKIRLGRAYLQVKDFTKAKKMFKDVLKNDPINALALKNLELAKSGKSECPANGTNHINTKSLLKEPGTTYEVKITVKSKGIHFDDFISGEELPIKVKRRSIDVYKIKKGKKVFIGEITDNYVVQKVSHTLSKNERVCVSYVRGKEQNMWLLVKASSPIFKPDKIEIRPYLKKGTIEEPELEIEIEEEIE